MLCVAVLMLGGCGGADDDQTAVADTPTEQAEAPPKAEVEEPNEGEVTEDATDEPAPEPDAGQTNITFEEPFAYESNGVSLAVTDLSITSREFMVEQDPSLDDLLDEGTQTMLALNMQATNDSGQTINFYPNQGTLKVGREQVDADLFLSDDFAGNDWQDATDDGGAVIWMLSAPYQEVVQAGEATLTVSAPSSVEDFSSMGKPVELTITWEPLAAS